MLKRLLMWWGLLVAVNATCLSATAIVPDTPGAIITNTNLAEARPIVHKSQALTGLHTHAINTLADIDDAELVITYADCGTKTGKITGLKGQPTMTYEWHDKNDLVVGRKLDLVDITYGTYTLIYKDTDGSVKTYGPLTVKNTSGPSLDESNKVVIPGSCAESNGSITGITVTSTLPLTYRWVRMPTQEQVGDQLDLLNIGPGTYRLQISDSNRCDYIRTSNITITGNDQIQVDASKVVVSDENCGDSKGSIKGLLIQNPDPRQVITWRDLSGKIWGTSVDLVNVPAGTYILSIVYQSGACPYEYSATIKSKGAPVIDDSNVQIVLPYCGDRFAVIKNLQVTGIGKLTYVWYNTEGKEVGYEKDLLNVGARTYYLKVTDESGCGPGYSRRFIISNEVPGFPFDESTAIITRATCTSKASVTGIEESPFLIYTWRNQLGDIVSNRPNLDSIAGGEYTLTVSTPCDGPQSKIVKLKYNLGPATASFKDFEVKQSDACYNQNSGLLSIKKDYTVRGVRWVDNNNNTVSTEDTATGLPAGIYSLYLSSDDCEILYGKYTINNIAPPAAPTANDVQLCSSSNGKIYVSGKNAALYRLYDSNESTDPIKEQPNGAFDIQTDVSRTYYVSQITGTCESERTPVIVQIGLLASDVMNTFTPNGDGINDYWKIMNIEKYPNALIQVFNRSGQRVYQSRGYAKPFYGSYNGRLLPSGSYFYIINLNNSCAISGSLTLLH